MLLGSAGRLATRISLLGLLLVGPMPMTILPIRETITSKQSLLLTTMLLFLVFWLDLAVGIVALTSFFQVHKLSLSKILSKNFARLIRWGLPDDVTNVNGSQ